jgi:O-methyltransferase
VSEPAPAAQIWRLARGALATRTLGIVADLGVADALAPGPRPVAELAPELGADRDTLQRLLRALASDGVFAELDAGVFANTPASELLRRGQPDGWHDFAHLFGDLWYRAAANLDAATSEASFPRSFGSDFWPWLAEHPEERASFDRAMAAGAAHAVDRLAAAGWHGDETVADVGGGNGSTLLGLLRRVPGLRGIVFDLPETQRDEASFGERCTFVSGSFFEHVPPADVYILSTILHDWDDLHAAAILRTIHAAAEPGARVLILDAVIEPGNEPHGAKWLDLLMLVLAGGRERTEAEWRVLVDGAGFELVGIEDGLIEAHRR